MNKNKLLFVLVASLAIFSTVFAQLRPNVSFKKLHAIGQGLAINTQDPYDFHIFKIAVGEIRINNTEVRVGVAIHDKTVYLLKNIVVENGSFSATIMTTNMTEIGTINLTKFYRENVEIWVGSAVVNSINYNVYIIGIRRELTNDEKGFAIGEYCKEHPENEQCKGLGLNYRCNVSSENCRERIAAYCRDHPTDDRCKHLVYQYCRENMDDLRCREAFEKFCTANPTNPLCKNIIVDYCRTHTNDTRCRDLALEYCRNHPWDENCYKAAYKYCQANPNETMCGTIRTMATNYCKDHPKDWRCIEIAKRYCNANPTDENCLNALRNFCEDNPRYVACIAAKVTYCQINPTDVRCT